MIARKYFESTFGTPYVFFETARVAFDKKNNIWVVEVEVQPLYATQKKRYRLEISAEGEVNNVEQISASAEG